jgi:hypothetical protein
MKLVLDLEVRRHVCVKFQGMKMLALCGLVVPVVLAL